MNQSILDLYYRLSGFNKKARVSIGLITGKFIKYPIVPIESVAEEVGTFKEETEEVFHIHNMYGFIKRGSFVATMPKLPLWLIRNAVVYYNSDFIKVGDSVVWSKRKNFNFCKLLPTDRMLASYEDDSLIIKKPSKIHKVECAFSLIGTHCDIWSHNLSDFFPKLSLLEKAIEIANKKISVLVPAFRDSQLKQLIYETVGRYNNVDILVVNNNEAVEVKSLFHIDRPCYFTDHELYVEIGDSIQPKLISDILKKDLVAYYKRQLNIGDIPQEKKLFLARKPGWRNISNYTEVEDYFKKKGFEVVEPHKLSLEDKIRLFSSAKYVVGPYSSAFSNTIFSKVGTKCLIFTNYSRSFECWLTMQEQYFGIDILTVTGADSERGSRAHCGYTIPLPKIMEAARYHGIIDD